jgi:hypothetical protein
MVEQLRAWAARDVDPPLSPASSYICQEMSLQGYLHLLAVGGSPGGQVGRFPRAGGGGCGQGLAGAKTYDDHIAHTLEGEPAAALGLDVYCGRSWVASDALTALRHVRASLYARTRARTHAAKQCDSSPSAQGRPASLAPAAACRAPMVFRQGDCCSLSPVSPLP